MDPTRRVKGLHPSFGERATPVKIARAGKNALDFHLSFYMGYIASRHPDARFVVVSNDKGYGPMLEHAAELGFLARQIGFGAVRVTKAARTKSAAQKSAPAKKAAAKKVVEKEAVAKKVVATQAPPAKKKPPAPPAKSAGKAAAANPATGKASVLAVKKPPEKKAAVSGSALAAKAGSAGSAGVKGGGQFDLGKAVRHVLASLKKTTSPPSKRPKLMAAIKSLLGPSASDRDAHSVLANVLAGSKVVIDDRGSVKYHF